MARIVLIILIKLSNVPRWGKNTFLLFADVLVILTASLLAFAVRFNPDQWIQEIEHFFYGGLWLCSFMMVSLQIDSSFTRETLGWTPLVSVVEGIRRMVQG